MYNRVSVLGLTLVVLGAVLFLKLVGEINSSYGKIYENMLLFYGLVSVFVSIDNAKRGSLFLGVISFMVGVLLYILNNFDILSTNKIILPSLFFVLSSAVFFLFLDNLKESLFLFISVILGFIGIVSLNFYDSFEWVSFAASVSKTVYGLWPYLFIIIGVGVLTDRRK